MSAFVVSKTHIDAMVTAGLTLGREGMHWYDSAEKTHKLDYLTADETGAMLVATNVESVNYRYCEGNEEETYTFTRVGGTPDPVVILSAIACYEYQSCEHPGWKTSDARAFCETLKGVAINALPGYSAVPWELPDGYHFGDRKRVA